MRKLKIIIYALIAVAVPFAVAATTYASGFRSGTDQTVAKNETVDHTLFISGQTVQVDGTIKGDLFCAGQNITITGTVEGDVLCAGMNVTVNGDVKGDVRLAGQSVSLAGDVDKNASLAGSTITVASGAKIGGDLQTAGSATTMSGEVARDADMAGADLTINGMIGRDLQTAGDNLTVQSGTQVKGNVTYYSHNEIHRESGADVAGKVTRKEPVEKHNEKPANPVPGIIMSFLGLLAFGYVLLALFPRKLRELTDHALLKPGRTVLFGLVACVLVPVAIIASFVTLIGFMVGIVLLFAWIVVMIFAWVLASYYAGRLVFMRTSISPFLAILVGVVIVSILLLIPIINVLTVIAVALFGSGMVVEEFTRWFKKPAYENLSQPAPAKKRKA